MGGEGKEGGAYLVPLGREREVVEVAAVVWVVGFDIVCVCITPLTRCCVILVFRAYAASTRPENDIASLIFEQ